MKKVALVLSMLALACGGAGFALGAATFARADDEVRTDVRTVTTTRSESVRAEPRVAPIAPAIAPVTGSPSRSVARTDEATEPRVRARRLVVTSGIAGHEPADTVGTMAAGEHERVYAFVELANTGGAGHVVVTFERDGGPTTGHVELDVPAHVGRWRTWAYSRGVDRAGEWNVVVRDERGAVIAEQAFVVE